MSKQVNFGEAISLGFKKWNVMHDTASLSEYWYWTLFSFLVGLADPYLWYLPTVVLLVPTISLLVRRFKDAGVNSRLLYLWLLCPGIIVALVFGAYLGNDSLNNIGAQTSLLALFFILSPVSAGLGIFTLIVTVRQAKTFEQGNKWAKPAQLSPETVMPAKKTTAKPAAKKTPAADLPDDLPTLGSK
jgi:uncharacterized membrane protein YhaH (DUF805 family)